MTSLLSTNGMKRETSYILTNKNGNAYGKGHMRNTKKNRQLRQQPPALQYIFNILINLKSITKV